MGDERNILLVGQAGVNEEDLKDLFKFDGWKLIEIIKFDKSNLDEQSIAIDISSACNKIKKAGNKLAKILFIFGLKLDEKEVKIYNIVKKRIFFDENIAKYTGIVRVGSNNGFSETEIKNKDDDIKNLRDGENSSKKVKKFIESIIPKEEFEKAICLNFPSLKYAKETEKDGYAKTREESRTALLEYLNKSGSYGPNFCLKTINEIFENYLESGEMEKKLKEKRKEVKSKTFIGKAKSTLVNKVVKNKEIEKVDDEIKVGEKKKEIESSSLKAVIEVKTTKYD